MSGIAGFYQTEQDYTEDNKWNHTLSQMNESLLHRGPNGSDIHLTPHAGFAQTRLSVIYTGENSRPLVKHKGERTCMITCSGELFNTRELKRLLHSYSLFWETSSDPEIILNGYLAMGTDFFKEMSGTFAFAIYDKNLDSLILCRDRIGARPLFYHRSQETVIFGSEPKALFAYGLKPLLNQDSFREIFGLGPARTLGKGIFKDLCEVLPGHFLTFKGSHMEDSTYWQLTAKEHTDSYEETVDIISCLVYDSIRRQMISDIPISCFLSGGLDSSIISALCAKKLAKKGKQLNTFSFDFADNTRNFKANAFQSSLDRPYVDTMVSHIDSNHTYLTCDSTTQANYLYKAVDAADLPCMGDIEASLLYFCEKASGRSRIALTGEGADEIFGGYPWFHRGSTLNEHNFPWSNDMSFRTSLLTDDFLRQMKLAEYSLCAYEKTISETPRLEGDTPLAARRREISYLTFRWFMVTLLNRMDRTSMYSGYQARVPFGDHRLAEYLYNIPWEMKCRDGINKNLLIQAGRTLLPNEILYRKKSPYPKTYDPAYEQLLGGRLKEVLADPNSPLLDIVDKTKVNSFLSSPSDYGKPWYGQLMAGPQMLAYLLQVNYWMQKYHLSL